MVRTYQQSSESVETYSPAEERFNRRRRTTGLWLGPLVFLIVWFLPLSGLSSAGHRMSAILAMVVVLWMTEALPMAVTAILGPVLAIVLRVAPARQALAPFADPIIFLFIGSFILAEAMFVHGLDRRIAFTALSSRLVGASAGRILVAYGAVATGLSMWISNTATTAMMFPIGLSILAHLNRFSSGDRDGVRRFAIALMLITSFGASVGGMATPVGTPPNLIGIGMLDRLGGIRISFFEWMAIGLPIVVVLFGFLCVYFYLRLARGVTVGADSVGMVDKELEKLGPISAGQRNVLIAFGTTVALWISPGLLAVLGMEGSPFSQAYAAAMPESVAAMLGAILLFLLPVDWRQRQFTLTWNQAAEIDWGIVLLYGGGLAMGELAFSTGLAEAMGKGITSWLPAQTSLALTILFTGAAILLSEATSNTASANMIVPIAIAVAHAANVRVLEPALGATLGASMGFMMPISTAPNAIVYSSGYIPITAMIRYGIVLDLVAFVVIVSAVMLLGPVLF